MWRSRRDHRHHGQRGERQHSLHAGHRSWGLRHPGQSDRSSKASPRSRSSSPRLEPGAPDTLSATSPVTQPGRRSRPAASPPTVRVVDRFGNAVPDALVAWQVTAGQGEVSEPLTRTAQDGSATVEWTLGNRIGVQKLTAAVEQADCAAGDLYRHRSVLVPWQCDNRRGRADV